MRTCTIDGCGKRHLARGLCSTHYGQQDPNRHKPRRVPCTWCGTIVTRAGGGGRKYGPTCSTQCRAYLAQCGTPSVSRELVHIPRAPRTDPRPRPTQRPRRFTAGTCRICASPFVTIYSQVTCSPECQALSQADTRRDHKHRYRARKRGAYRQAVSPLSIYQRDDWTCRLCGTRTDPSADPQSDHAPSLDHIIPLANGGTHEPSNVWTAHRGCNARRSNRPFMLVGRAKVQVATLF